MEFENGFTYMGTILIISGLLLLLLPNLIKLELGAVHPLLLWKIWDKDGFVVYTSPILLIISIIVMLYNHFR